jgi:hypothetical protein
MKRKISSVKSHVVSMRISADEWETLREVMKYLQLDSVSDVMREAFRHISEPSSFMVSAAGEGHGSGRGSYFSGHSARE